MTLRLRNKDNQEIQICPLSPRNLVFMGFEDSRHSWISGSFAVVAVALFELWTSASPGQRDFFYISISWCRQNELDVFMNVPKSVNTCTINLICLAYCTLGIHLHNACMHISAWEIMVSSVATLYRKSSLKAMLSSQCIIH